MTRPPAENYLNAINRLMPKLIASYKARIEDFVDEVVRDDRVVLLVEARGITKRFNSLDALAGFVDCLCLLSGEE